MSLEEEQRKLAFKTRLKIFQETEKPDTEQNRENLANWRALLAGLETGLLLNSVILSPPNLQSKLPFAFLSGLQLQLDLSLPDPSSQSAC